MIGGCLGRGNKKQLSESARNIVLVRAWVVLVRACKLAVDCTLMIKELVRAMGLLVRASVQNANNFFFFFVSH